MTTTLPEGTVLRWDSFIEHRLDEIGSFPLPNLAAEQVPASRQALDAWRKREWKVIYRSLRDDHDVDWPESIEPHWVGPGSAVYWQRQVETKAVEVASASGRPVKELVDVEKGWVPTSPLPADASGIAYYLRKGLRLRPSDYDESVELSSEPAPSPEAEGESTGPQYYCDRHPGLRGDGVQKFVNWRAYRAHCHQSLEDLDPNQLPPQTVLNQMAQYSYWCVKCQIGFNSPRAATQHSALRTEMRPALHISAEEMRNFAVSVRKRIKEAKQGG